MLVASVKYRQSELAEVLASEILKNCNANAALGSAADRGTGEIRQRMQDGGSPVQTLFKLWNRIYPWDQELGGNDRRECRWIETGDEMSAELLPIACGDPWPSSNRVRFASTMINPIIERREPSQFDIYICCYNTMYAKWQLLSFMSYIASSSSSSSLYTWDSLDFPRPQT